jgi:hypothetical protein
MLLKKLSFPCLLLSLLQIISHFGLEGVKGHKDTDSCCVGSIMYYTLSMLSGQILIYQSQK